ncbi:MAG: methyltransferase domain-containing protein [Desulfobacterales bacterium]|jgi:ubiquinone/menaquinone biosynthesis C-methylase UbiE
MMPKLRAGRRLYYNIFSYFYDGFIRLHSRNYGAETRRFLAGSAQIENKAKAKVLDICCGTGSVILSFAERFRDISAIGYDFSHGMLVKARAKDISDKLILIEGDAAILPFKDDVFDVVCCSHALYELKGAVRREALLEMRRVVKSNGRVLIMEHEVPRKSFIKMLFYLRMLMMGPKDSREFLKQGISPFKKIFSEVTLSHTKSGKSKLFICQKAQVSHFES